MVETQSQKRGLPRDFAWLWAGQGVSELGTQLTALALPTLAILTLSASTFEVGLIVTMENLATPLIGLLVGVFIDRVRRRGVLIVADIGRMLVLLGVVVLYATDTLRLEHLYITAGLIGVFTVFFTVAYHAYVPFLVGRDQVMRANTRLEITSSGALLAGPGAGGLLISQIGSAATIALDALSFGVSAIFTGLIRRRERRPDPPPEATGIRQDIREGMRFVWSTPVLRALTITSSLGNLGFSMVLAILAVFAYRTLDLSPAMFGLILTISSAGFLISAFVAGGSARRLGAGNSLLLANSIFAVGLLVTPLAQLGAPVAVLFAAQFLVNLSLPWYNITSQSLQQVWTPDHMLGRVNATMRTVVWGATPVGAFLGGVLGQTLGVTWAIAIGGLIAVGSSAALMSHRIRSIRDIEPPSEE